MIRQADRPLTENQKEVLRKIIARFLNKQIPHTFRELAEELGKRHNGGTRGTVDALKAKGYLFSTDSASRGLKPSEKAQEMTWNITEFCK